MLRIESGRPRRTSRDAAHRGWLLAVRRLPRLDRSGGLRIRCEGTHGPQYHGAEPNLISLKSHAGFANRLSERATAVFKAEQLRTGDSCFSQFLRHRLRPFQCRGAKWIIRCTRPARDAVHWNDREPLQAPWSGRRPRSETEAMTLSPPRMPAMHPWFR